MRQGVRTYICHQVVSAAVMIVMLLWLTVSAPFIYAGQLLQNETTQVETPLNNGEEEAPLPLTNSTEEKKPAAGASIAEEFFYTNHEDEYDLILKKRYRGGDKPTSYIAFHCKLISPPPDDCNYSTYF